MDRVGLRNKLVLKPVWKFTAKRGKLERQKGKRGIDWWRYQEKILIPKLITFVKECEKDRPNALV
jgi:hypothetical protein